MIQFIRTKIMTSGVLLTIAIAFAFLIGALACHYTQFDRAADDTPALDTVVAGTVR